MSLSLDQLAIAEPCSADLAAMPGDDRARFCSTCNRHVHLVSGLTRAEATDLLCRSASHAGHLACIQLERNTLTGEVITLDYAKPRRRRWPMVAVLIVTTGAAGAVTHFALKKAPLVAPPVTTLISAGLMLPAAPTGRTPAKQTAKPAKKLAPKANTKAVPSPKLKRTS